MSLKIIQTGDGSSTLFHEKLNEHYHSVHGARQESEHVYIKSGLEYFFRQKNTPTSIDILEIGFGTGLNVLLAYYWAKKNKVAVELETIEAFPVSQEIISDYIFDVDDNDTVALKLHELDWEKPHAISPFFDFKKLHNTLEDITLENEQYNVIFFDAFAPNKQEDIWSESNLSKMYRVLKTGGCLVTYCAKGEIRRRFEKVGFEAQRIQGPPGKREMLRCLK